VDVGSQIFLAALHFGFVMLVLAWALWRGKDNAGRKIVPLALKYVFGAVAICLLLSALESFRVIAVARQIDFSTAKYISRTMLAIAFYSPQGVQLVQSLVNYFGSLVFGNLLPVISVILALLAGLVVARLYRRGPVLPQPSGKWLFSMLLLCAAFCLQARFLARRSEIGALACVLPVFFIYAERIPFMILRLKPKLSLWRVFKRCYLTAFVIAVFLAAFVLYAFEFRDVSLHPVLVRSDKGTIRLPDLPINRAFVQMVAFVRNNDLTRFKVVVVPTSGIQYWIGGQFSPFAWASIIQPEQYRSPWSDNLKAGLEKNGCIFIELCRQEVNVQSIVSSAEWSWIDGPAYRVERWKELFPLIWNHIQTNAVPVAEFGPTNAPYFRVYIDRKLKSADNLPKTE
jgi:hypothetical protein